MPKHTKRNMRKRRNVGGVKRQQSNRNPRMVTTYGDNEPQSFPFQLDRKAQRRCVRFVAPRIQADANGNFLHRVSLRNPSRALDGTGTYTDALPLSQVFDTYKPVKLRIELVPVFATNAFSVGSLVLAPDYDDLDTSQVVTTISEANQYNERKIIDCHFKTITEFKIPTLQSGSIPGSVTTSPAVVQSNGFLDFNAPPYDGVVYLVGQGFPANLAVFDLYLEMDLLLKFAR